MLFFWMFQSKLDESLSKYCAYCFNLCFSLFSFLVLRLARFRFLWHELSICWLSVRKTVMTGMIRQLISITNKCHFQDLLPLPKHFTTFSLFIPIISLRKTHLNVRRVSISTLMNGSIMSRSTTTLSMASFNKNMVP